MPFREKVKSYLTGIFNNPYAMPERAVTDQMEKDGWTFRYETLYGPYMAINIPDIKTPAGDSVTGPDSTERARTLYLATVEEKRKSLKMG